MIIKGQKLYTATVYISSFTFETVSTVPCSFVPFLHGAELVTGVS